MSILQFQVKKQVVVQWIISIALTQLICGSLGKIFTELYLQFVWIVGTLLKYIARSLKV